MAAIAAALKDMRVTAILYANQVCYYHFQELFFSILLLLIYFLHRCTVHGYQPICQYNEDCPPTKLCDRLNRRCINPCAVDSCGENADCTPANHGVECRCLNGFIGNPYIECTKLRGCRSNAECSSSEACINGRCNSPCQCGINALCEVINHKARCLCPTGYSGDASIACNPPSNPCEPNPCGINAMCELDRGNPICFCPKGLTGNPFKNCSE